MSQKRRKILLKKYWC